MEDRKEILSKILSSYLIPVVAETALFLSQSLGEKWKFKREENKLEKMGINSIGNLHPRKLKRFLISSRIK
jgi:hypothetical protein